MKKDDPLRSYRHEAESELVEETRGGPVGWAAVVGVVSALIGRV